RLHWSQIPMSSSILSSLSPTTRRGWALSSLGPLRIQGLPLDDVIWIAAVAGRFCPCQKRSKFLLVMIRAAGQGEVSLHTQKPHMTSARFPAVPWLNCHYMLGIFHGALLTPSSTHIGGARHRATGLGVPCARKVSVRRRYRCWLYGPAVSQLLSQPGT